MRTELRCRLFPGQFSSEFAVIVETFNGLSLSLFASRDEVMFDQEPTQDIPTDGWLSVQVLERHGNNVLVTIATKYGREWPVSVGQVRPASQRSRSRRGVKIEGGMILSNVELQRALDSGRLVIRPEPGPRHPDPSDPRQYCPYDTHSVDLSLGDEIVTPSRAPTHLIWRSPSPSARS